MNMESSEIVRRNEAIAKFMGLTCPPTYDGPNSVGRGYYDPNELRYHDEYQWIMPVVEKVLYGKPDANFTIWYETGEPREFLLNSIWILVSDYCLALEEQKS